MALLRVDPSADRRLRVHPLRDRGRLLPAADLPTGARACRRRRHRGVSKFPSVRRDFALVVGRDVTAQMVESLVKSAVGDVLVDFRLIDVYQGEGIDSNEKSLALGLTLQQPSATLTEEQISMYIERALIALSEGVGARLR